MKIAIMQPYLFPYIGYFQLIHAVDFFGIGDDVQFIKSGWINRNRILVNNRDYMFTFSVKKDSFDKRISDRYFSDNFEKEKNKFINILNQYYCKAPYFKSTMEVIKLIFEFSDTNISEFIQNHLKIICSYLNIEVTFISADEWHNESYQGVNPEQRLIEKLNNLEKYNIDQFINSIGGKELYNKDFFLTNNIKLNFLKPSEIIYKQFTNDFIPNLSIIDVMMFNSKQKLKTLLTDYYLE